jgi:hypothetical protein
LDKEKLEKMAKIIRGWCQGEGDRAGCCPIIKQMKQYGDKKETEKKEKDTGKAD